METTIKINLEFFAVRSKDGKYFRSVGFGGGKNWVDDIKKAKIYPKIGQARARVTWFKANYPDFGVADIIKIIANEAIVLSEVERVEKSINKKEEKELKRQKERAERALKQAEEDFKKAGEKLRKLKVNEF